MSVLTDELQSIYGLLVKVSENDTGDCYGMAVKTHRIIKSTATRSTTAKTQ